MVTVELMVPSSRSRRLGPAVWDDLDGTPVRDEWDGTACSGIGVNLPRVNGPKAFMTPSMLSEKSLFEQSRSVLEDLSIQFHVSNGRWMMNLFRRITFGTLTEAPTIVIEALILPGNAVLPHVEDISVSAPRDR